MEDQPNLQELFSEMVKTARDLRNVNSELSKVIVTQRLALQKAVETLARVAMGSTSVDAATLSIKGLNEIDTLIREKLK